MTIVYDLRKHVSLLISLRLSIFHYCQGRSASIRGLSGPLHVAGRDLYHAGRAGTRGFGFFGLGHPKVRP